MSQKIKSARNGEQNVSVKRAKFAPKCVTNFGCATKVVTQNSGSVCKSKRYEAMGVVTHAPSEQNAGRIQTCNLLIRRTSNHYPGITILFDHRHVATRSHAAPVEVRVTHARRRVYFGTGVKLCSHQWRDGRIVNTPQSNELTRAINRKFDEVSRRVADLWDAGEFSLESLRESFKQRNSVPSKSPAEWMRDMLEQLPLREGTKRHQVIIIEAVEASGLFDSWEDVTAQSLTDWDYWLRHSSRSKSEATLHNYHKTLKAFINRAIVADIMDFNPYSRVKIGKTVVASRPRYLTGEERRLIESAVLPDELARVRDLFVVMMYTGLAYSDVSKLTRDKLTEEGGRLFLTDTRTKTGTPYKLMLLPQVVEIFERYDYELPIMSLEAMNRMLKALSAAVGLGKSLTTHMGRHTFATWALSQGVPIEVVSKMLAHTDIKTTQIYARVLQEDVNRGFELLGSR